MDILVAQVLGDIALVLVVSALFGAAARRLGQPTVIGQILAGLLLGPSALGRLPGHLTARIFPSTVLPALTVLAQVAVVIFMFAVGYELNWRLLRGRRRTPLLVAIGAFFVPMGLGSGLVLVTRSQLAVLGQPHLSRSFVLFVGVAISITALPVLAAIAAERGIAGTTAGTTAISAAGLMDVTAWLVLAAVLVATQGKAGRPWPLTLLLLCCFIAFMLLVMRPALRWWISRRSSAASRQLPVALALALGSACVTASLGLHPVFGGLLAGLTMPGMGGTPDADVLRPMDQIGGLLLPLFFVVTGLSLHIENLDGTAFVVLALVCVAASAGKLGPAYLAARVSGLDLTESATVAVLVNTRGLTELIVLNVGLSAGLIGQKLFSVLVLMALIMTVVTAPLLRVVGAPAASPAPREQRRIAPPHASASEI